MILRLEAPPEVAHDRHMKTHWMWGRRAPWWRRAWALLLVLGLQGCVVVPRTTEFYDPDCQITTRQMRLETVQIGVMGRCSNEGCATALVFIGATAAATAAATSKRPEESLDASGYLSLLSKSLTVIRPVSRPLSSISGSFSIRCWANRAIASFGLMPVFAVTSGIGVMMSLTRVVGR